MGFNKRTLLQLLLVLLLDGLAVGCIEPYAFEEKDFDSVLIVDGMLSDQYRKHKIYLSRSYAFGGSPSIEEEAKVQVVTNDGDLYLFKENKAGYYEAVQAFAATRGKQYTLEVITVEGKEYHSTPMTLPPAATMDAVYGEASINDRDEAGIRIFLDASSKSNASYLYRFEYEETYKIVAPYWTPYDAVVIYEGISTFATDVILRETEERVCYGKDLSEKILLRSTLDQTEDRLRQETIHFIPISDPKLQHRYSILVRLLVESPAAYSYFETIQDLSLSSSAFFTEKQPGYIAGNMMNRSNPLEKVGGFFRVSAVAEKRIFFNLEDFYPDAPKPEYFKPCVLNAPSTEGSRGNRNLLNSIYNNYGKFYDYNDGSVPGGPLILVNTPCGDCTVLGSNRVPPFWIP